MVDTDVQKLAIQAADIVSAYTSNNVLKPEELPSLLQAVLEALRQMAVSDTLRALEQARKPTSAEIMQSITSDGLISFIDGKPYSSLDRHLANHGIDFEVYRRRFDLPENYPSVSSSLKVLRSKIAVRIGRSRKPQYNAARNTTAQASIHDEHDHVELVQAELAVAHSDRSEVEPQVVLFPPQRASKIYRSI